MWTSDEVEDVATGLLTIRENIISKMSSHLSETSLSQNDEEIEVRSSYDVLFADLPSRILALSFSLFEFCRLLKRQRYGQVNKIKSILCDNFLAILRGVLWKHKFVHSPVHFY